MVEGGGAARKVTEVSRLKRMMGLDPRKELEAKSPEQTGSKVNALRMMFEPQETVKLKKNGRTIFKDDDSWRRDELGCDKVQTVSNPKKRKTETCCRKYDEFVLEKDDGKQLLDFKDKTWDGRRVEPGTVGLNEGGQVLRKNGKWSNLGWKGGKDEEFNFNGHSPQPMPKRGTVYRKKKMMMIDDTGIQLGHCDVIGGEIETHKT